MSVRKSLRFLAFFLCLCLFLGAGMSVSAAASIQEARFVIMILPPSEQSAAVTIQIEDTGGTGFVDAQVKLGENGQWQDITACLLRDRAAYFEITHSGRVYVSVTDHAGIAHVSSRHIEFAGTAPPVPPPTPPTPPAPPTIPTPSPDTSTAPAVPTVPTEPTEPTTPGTPGNVSVTPIDGTGTVMESSVQTPEVREFFTITTQRGGVFYLVVDRARPDGNVYLLSEVTEETLTGFVREDEPAQAPPPEPPPVFEPPAPPPETPVAVEPEPQPPVSSGSSSNPIFLIIFIVLAVGGAGYYIKIVRPRRENADPFDDGEDVDDYEDENTDSHDDDEVYVYEDEYGQDGDERKE